MPLFIVGSIVVLYLAFVIYIKIKNPGNPLWMNPQYNSLITEPLAKMGCASAQLKMGLHYLYGWGSIPPQDELDKAIYWLEKALESGNEDALEELAIAKNPENYPEQFL